MVGLQNVLPFINYCAHDIATEVSTCFGLNFQGEQVCIQDAEAILKTIKVFNPNLIATP